MSPSGAATQSARTLVPCGGDLGPWYRAEVHGLPEAQLDFTAPAPAPEWLWWSIRRQTSHRAITIIGTESRSKQSGTSQLDV